MLGSTTALRQERLKKSARPNPPGLFTINEEDEQQKNGNSTRVKGTFLFCSGISGLPVGYAAQQAQQCFISSSVCYREPVSDWCSLAVHVGSHKCECVFKSPGLLCNRLLWL